MESIEVLRTGESWIQKTPGICGGDACIRDTRITVWGLADWRRLGARDADILSSVQGLRQADLEAAWDYVRQHPEEIDQAIQANSEA